MTTMRLLVVSESISTSSTVGLTGGGLRIATLGVAEGEPDGVRTRDRAQYTQRRRRYTLRRLRVGRQSIRERQLVPCFCFSREQPNPVQLLGLRGEVGSCVESDKLGDAACALASLALQYYV